MKVVQLDWASVGSNIRKVMSSQHGSNYSIFKLILRAF